MSLKSIRNLIENQRKQKAFTDKIIEFIEESEYFLEMSYENHWKYQEFLDNIVEFIEESNDFIEMSFNNHMRSY